MKPIDTLTFGQYSDDIQSNVCNKMFGCGESVNPETDFKDDISRKEWGISSLCQNCQDSVFG